MIASRSFFATLVLLAPMTVSAWAAGGLELDGSGCPVAHCNRLDNSFQDLPPLLSVGASQRIDDPAVSPSAWFFLGCVTGEVSAVCAYDSPSYPALAAFDLQTGSLRWTSPPEDLPGTDKRWPAGLLLATFGIPKQRYVFAANPVEIVAYTENGLRVWKRKFSQLVPQATAGVGFPVSLTFDDAGEIVFATPKGWVVKVNPVSGALIDAYQMRADVYVGGTLYRGTFTNTNSPAIVGDTLYLVVQFQPDAANPLDPKKAPVHVVRIELTRPDVPGQETRIRPLIQPTSQFDAPPDRVAIGVNSAGGSPPTMLTQDGRVLIFADADVLTRGGILRPLIAGVLDDHGALRLLWRSKIVSQRANDDIMAAPALHAASKTLIVTTTRDLYVYRNVDTLVGWVPSPAALALQDLLSCGTEGGPVAVESGSPFGLSYDRGTSEIIAYTNFRVTPLSGTTYGYLGAFALSARGTVAGRRVWCMPLNTDAGGGALPGRGTFGQAALFRFDTPSGPRTGLIVNTEATGTYMFRSIPDAALDPSLLFDRVSATVSMAGLRGKGYALRSAPVYWPTSCQPGSPGCIRFVNNPVTRYGLVQIADGTGAPTHKFQLDGTDAIVLYGFTPPPITYYSFTMNQFSQYDPAGGSYVDTVSSIGLSQNQITLNLLGGPFDRFFALIVATDHPTRNAVHRALLEAGVPEATISHLLVPARFANASAAFPDKLTFLTRLTFRNPEEKALIDGFVGQSPANVRAMVFDGPPGGGDVQDGDLVRWEETVRQDTSEALSGVEADLQLLVDQVVSRYRSQGYLLLDSGGEVLRHADPQRDCRDALRACNFDAPDSLYARFMCSGTGDICLPRLPNVDDVIVVVGVDHHRYAQDRLSTYFSYAVTRTTDLAGVSTIIDLDLRGSAGPFLEGTGIDPDNLFVIKVSRACAGDPFCMEVPVEPVGIPLSEPFLLTTRVYLDKIAATAPNPPNLIPARLLWFGK